MFVDSEFSFVEFFVAKDVGEGRSFFQLCSHFVEFFLLTVGELWIWIRYEKRSVAAENMS